MCPRHGVCRGFFIYNSPLKCLVSSCTVRELPFRYLLVVDVTVSVNGQQSNLQGLPAGADIADFGQNGNIVVSCSRDAMNNEIGTMKQKSADILASVDYHRGVMESCDKMLNALNPEFAAKQQQEQKISQLESQIAEMAKGMSELMKFNKMLAEQLGVDPETNKKK